MAAVQKAGSTVASPSAYRPEWVGEENFRVFSASTGLGNRVKRYFRIIARRRVLAKKIEVLEFGILIAWVSDERLRVGLRGGWSSAVSSPTESRTG